MSAAETRLQEIIPNFRRVTGTKLFRSSRPDRLTNGGNVSLLGKVGIKTILDMRSSAEIPSETILDTYYEKMNVNQGKTDCGVQNNATEANNYLGKHYYVQLLGGSYARCVSKRLPYLWQLIVLILFCIDGLLGTMYGFKTIISRVLNKEGCAQQYIDILSSCGKQICKGMKLLCDPENVPSLICCAWGKDRTGIISAIVQELCGVDREIILDDYAKSEQVLGTTSQGKEMTENLKKFGLHERYTEAKRETMEKVFEFFQTDYGSVTDYLLLHGLTEADIAKIVENVKV